MTSELPIVEGWKNPTIWSTEQLPPARQFDRWCEFVNEAHLHWAIKRDQYDRFPAFIREGRFGEFRMANLTASGSRIRGNRGKVEIAQDEEALYNFLYVAGGSISLEIDGKDVNLFPGNFVLWDTTRPMVFVTGEGLQQITLAVTHERLHRIFPEAGTFVGRTVACSTGFNQLLADHLVSLDQQFGDLTGEQARTALDATINLAISSLKFTNSANHLHSSAILRRVKDFIEANIAEYELSIPIIAAEHAISVRHLHRLFHEIDTSVSTYIIQRRLELCREDLISCAHKRATITDIAFRWGFADSGTFSKCFRRHYGVTPRQFRRSASG